MHSWSTFGARTSHEQIQIHKIHHGLDLEEATVFPLLIYFVPLHKPTSKWHFVLGLSNGSLEIPKVGTPATLGLLQLWGCITLCVDLWLRWGLKQSYSHCWELFNDMLHATCTQGNLVNSRLLVVGSQIANLTFGLSFGHNLCFRCPNGSRKLILDIYVSIVFQWNNFFFNAIGFDPCNRSLKIWKSTRTLNSQSGSSLGSVRVHSFTLSVIPRLPLILQPCNPLPWSWAQG
jgi:hypothetical protein